MGVLDWIYEIAGVAEPSGIEILFLLCAFLGTAFFLILMTMMLLGDIVGGVFDSAFDTDFSMDSDLSFELFSIQGLAAAIMMFGYVGMFTIKATDTEVYAVVAGGLAAGVSMYGVGLMLKGLNDLQVDGTMKHEDAIGQRGEIYSRIQAGQTGEVSVAVAGTLRTLKARCKDDDMALSTGSFVRVIDVIGATMIVVPLDLDEEVNEEE